MTRPRVRLFIAQKERARLCLPSRDCDIQQFGREVIQRLRGMCGAVNFMERVDLTRARTQRIQGPRNRATQNIQQAYLVFARSIG